MIGSSVHVRPDWVMLGMRDPARDGVMLLASKELTLAELSYEAEVADYGWAFEIRQAIVSHRYELRAEMATYVIITAPTYEQAFEHLFRTWRPDDYRTGPAPELEDGQRRLPPAPRRALEP